jgi:dTDP-glucose pyrophosphorylase
MENHIIGHTATIKEAISALNCLGVRVLNLFVIDSKGKLIGSVTDGDIRRSLLKGCQIADSITMAMNADFEKLIEDKFSYQDIDKLRKKNIHLVPLIGKDGDFVKLIDLNKIKSFIPVDALIMAGGEGRRLRPMTNETPKPLLKIGEKPIIEYNIDGLISFGITNIHISIRYLGQQLIDYFGDGKNKDVNIRYISEVEPLGTLGAVRLLPPLERETVLVMNSDLLTNIDLEDFYKAFIENDADMAIATIPYHVKVPYAVLQTHNNQVLTLQEKPTYTYYSNAGIYFIKKKLASSIPPFIKYDATDLIEELIRSGKRVVSYPILGYWLDIGKPEDYIKAQEDIKHLKF